MKPHPRIRKTIKWGGAVVTVLLVVAWVGSGFRYLGYGTPSGYGVELSYGWMWISHELPRPQRIGLYFIDPKRVHYYGWWFDRYNVKGEWGIAIPMWLLCMSLSFPTGVAWRLDTLAPRRRARLNLCPKCNYDRTGLAMGAVCPECGKASVMS